MRILMITPYLPYPLYSGGQIRSYNLIKNLSKKHQISLFSFIRKEEERQYLPELLKYCQEVEVFKKRKPWVALTLLKTSISFYPLLVNMYLFHKVKEKLEKKIREKNYDLIHVECFYVMPNLPKTLIPIVLAEQNIEYQVYKRYADRTNLFARPFLYFDVIKLAFWEKYFWKRAKMVVAASTLDKQIIEKEVKGKVSLVPNGVDLDYFANLVKKPNPLPTILFVGNFKWLQNRDAISFLIKEIWPKVRQKITNAKLLIVGRNAPQKLKEAIVESGAVLREDVAEITEVYQETDLLLAPIRIGGGTKFKILEAMAAGIPVVTTKEGVEGLEVKDGQEVLVGKEAKDLVEKVTEVLRDDDLRNNLIKKAKAKVTKNYNWQIIAQSLDRVWQEAVKDG